MRTKKSFINMMVVCGVYAIVMLTQVVTKSFFVKYLGKGLLGVNESFLRTASMLTIIEVGLSAGIIYKLYDPIANKNWNKVSVILCFLRKSYIGIAAIIFGMGLITTFFAIAPYKEHFSPYWLAWIFMLYVLDILASYLFCHKRAMFLADQKYYINKSVYAGCQVLMFVLQIAVLMVFQSLQLFVICKVLCKILESFIISFFFNKQYKNINLKTKETIPETERKDLFRNIRALLLHKISSAMLEPAITFIVAFHVTLFENDTYASYMIIAYALTSVTGEIFNAITASFGNLLTNLGKDKAYSNFKILYFLNFLISSFMTVSFFNIITPFINVWLEGRVATFSLVTAGFISAYIYIYSMKQSASMAKMSAGIYEPDKYLAVFGILVSIVFSWILVGPLGITGIMIGNIIGTLAVPYWCQPYLVYNRVFKRGMKDYHIKYLIYTVLTFAYTWLSYYICSKFTFQNNVVQVAVNFIICLFIPNILNIAFFFRTSEFKKLWSATKRIVFKR